MSKLIGLFLQWFDETRVWKWFARRVLAHLTFRFNGYPGFDFGRWGELRDVLHQAWLDDDAVYAFVLADRETLASKLIRLVSKSQWSHAGWLTWDHGFGPAATHMKGSGLIHQHVLNVLRECDDFAVVRFPTDKKKGINQRINAYIQAPELVAYDFEQELDDNASPLEARDIYCSELIWVCASDLLNLKPSEVLGRKCFSPEDVVRNGKIVWQHLSLGSPKPTRRQSP